MESVSRRSKAYNTRTCTACDKHGIGSKSVVFHRERGYFFTWASERSVAAFVKDQGF
ncbi:hypothetical protein [Trichloromonas sp.]|uniref:hypothetical protein n=1 Tax=Trichloromonas sp. TaxID=3069249 RepID=UPI002A4398C2|nr:hypothetical protein [Trichloromonas sp.]